MHQVFLCVSLLVLLCPHEAAIRAHAVAEEFTFHHENVLGTSLELRVRADDLESAARAEGRVLGEIERLRQILSGYDPTSEFQRWQAETGRTARVSPELFDILLASDRWRARSDGAFDPRVAALSRLWSACAAKNRLPTPTELSAARDQLGRPAWKLDPRNLAAERLSDCPLSLDGIAKGFIIERACAHAMEAGQGVHGLLLNVGGDLRAVGEAAWTVGLAPAEGDSAAAAPAAFLDVQNRSIATSGDTYRGFRLGANWYSHILDPRSGWPATQSIRATVVAPNGSDADALATILNVLPVEEGLALANSLEAVECLIVTRDGRRHTSAGWRQFERHQQPLITLTSSRRVVMPAEAEIVEPRASWGDDFELAVDFTINRPEGAGTGPYRRPYVVVWAEDANGQTVRTITLWISLGGSGPIQWLPDLRRWYRGDPGRSLGFKKNMVYTIARPTRPPGTYSVVWDGKDDLGEPLPPGTYTLFIEAAREHGTNQLIRKAVVLEAAPFAEELQGNVEIKSASIEYRRKPSPR